MGEDLVAFIRARLDEAEAGEWWHEQDCAGMPWGSHEPHCCGPRALQVRLAEAIWAIGDAWETVEKARHPFDPPTYASGVTDGRSDALRDILKRLAAIYRDHPDYDPEWKP